MQLLSITVSTARIAECPLCRMQLLPGTICFINDVALCRDCWTSTPQDIINAMYLSAHHAPVAQHWSRSRGLLLFTPSVSLPKNVASHLIDIRRDHVYAPIEEPT